MKTLAALLCLATTIAFAQDHPPKYGKTDAQILAMGLDKWMDFCGGKDGSNLGMIQASHAYASAAKIRNDRYIARSGMASDFRRLRSLLDDYEEQLTTVGYYISGGGSMWSVIGAGGEADVEDLIYIALGRAPSKAKSFRTSHVTHELTHAADAIDHNKNPNEDSGVPSFEAMKSLKHAQTDFAAISKITSKLDRHKSNTILSFCFDRAKMGAEGG